MIALLIASAVAVGGPLQSTSIADPVLTPGVVRHDLTEDQIRSTTWGEDRRLVTEAMKADVFARYGFSGEDDLRCVPDPNDALRKCEIDHRVPRCAGGADDILNLSPMPYGGPWNAAMKDRVEAHACRAFVEHRMTLEDAQAVFLGDWTVTYRAWFGEPQ